MDQLYKRTSLDLRSGSNTVQFGDTGTFFKDRTSFEEIVRTEFHFVDDFNEFVDLYRQRVERISFARI